MQHLARLAPVIALLAQALPAAAAPPPAATTATATPVLPAPRCDALFGSAELRARNAALRARRIDWIKEDDGGVTIAHTSQRWDAEPYRMRLRGVQLVQVQDGVAVFRVAPKAAARVGCAAGRYNVRVDSALSRRIRILAVLSEVVLVEHRGRLAYIAPPEVSAPRWLVAWRMEGEVVALSPAHLRGLIRSRIY